MIIRLLGNSPYFPSDIVLWRRALAALRGGVALCVSRSTYVFGTTCRIFVPSDGSFSATHSFGWISECIVHDGVKLQPWRTDRD